MSRFDHDERHQSPQIGVWPVENIDMAAITRQGAEGDDILIIEERPGNAIYGFAFVLAFYAIGWQLLSMFVL